MSVETGAIPLVPWINTGEGWAECAGVGKRGRSEQNVGQNQPAQASSNLSELFQWQDTTCIFQPMSAGVKMMGQVPGTPTWPLADHWCFNVLRLQPATWVCHHFPYCLMSISYWSLEDLRREWRMIRRYLDGNYWHSSHSPIPYSAPVRFDGVFHIFKPRSGTWGPWCCRG